MPISYRIDSVTFTGGDHVELQEDQFIVVVGPNNAGKSVLLRELQGVAVFSEIQRIVTSEARFEQRGTEEEFEAWLRATLEVRVVDGRIEETALGLGAYLFPSDAKRHWRNRTAGNVLGRYFCALADAESRLAAANPVEAINQGGPQPILDRTWATTRCDRLARVARGHSQEHLRGQLAFLAQELREPRDELRIGHGRQTRRVHPLPITREKTARSFASHTRFCLREAKKSPASAITCENVSRGAQCPPTMRTRSRALLTDGNWSTRKL